MSTARRPGRLVGGVILALLSSATMLAAQGRDTSGVRAVSLGGPRVGLTVLSSATVERAPSGLREGLEGFPVISQFGWQWETQFFTTPEGSTGVTELVLLLGGAERSVVLPSVTWLVGFRGANGAEFGVGPNLSLTGGSFVVAGGITIQSGSVNFPVNVGIAASDTGYRVSLLAGFVVASPSR